MAKNRKSIGGDGSSGGGGEAPQEDHTIHNQEIFDEICKQKGVGPKTKQKLREMLDFANENNLEMTLGETITSGYGDNPWYAYGGTARVTMIDHETGKKIHVFDDVLKGKSSDDVNKESMKNMLNGLRIEQEKTSEEFHGLFKDVLITNNRLMRDKSDGKMVRNHSAAFFDPICPKAITIQSNTLGQKSLVKVGENSNQFMYDQTSAESMAATFAHENAHAWDYWKIGNGATDTPSIFTEHGHNSGTIGPCKYATDYDGETISTIAEMVINHKTISGAYTRTGKDIENVFHEKYDKWPSWPRTSSDEKKLYDIWYDEWKPEIQEVESFMLK